MAYRPQVKTSNGMVDLPIDAETIKGKTLLEQTYPVGAIYLSIDSTSPASLFGGTWERIQDTFILAAGSTYAAGSTGGNAAHNHLLPIQQADGGKLGFIRSYGVADGAKHGVWEWTGAYQYDTTNNIRFKSYDTTNLPPYLSVYVWKRTA